MFESKRSCSEVGCNKQFCSGEIVFHNRRALKKVERARTCQLMRLSCGVGPSYVDAYRSTCIHILR